MLLGELAGGAQPCIVDGLEGLLVQLLRLGAVERQAQQDERVRQALQQNAPTRPLSPVRDCFQRSPAVANVLAVRNVLQLATA